MKIFNSKFNLIKVIVWLFAISLIVLLVWALLPKPIPVSVAVVGRGDFRQIIEEDGQTRAKDIYVVSAPASGNISRINLNDGDMVAKNQILATVTPNESALLDVRSILVLEKLLSSQKASVKKSEALVARSKTALATSRSDLERRKPLLKQGYISPGELDQFKLRYDLDKKEYDAAVAELKEAEDIVGLVKAALQHSFVSEKYKQKSGKYAVYLRSPEKARVLRILRKSSGAVEVGQPIAEIADPRKLEVVVDMLSTDAVKIPQDAKVLIKRWGGEQSLVGRVRLIEPRAFTKVSALGVDEQRVNVIIDFISPKKDWEKLGSGYKVDVEVILFDANNVLKVPVSALFRDKQQWAVFVIKRGKAVKKDIEVKWRNSEYAVVERGLKQGDRVVNYPSDQIRDGVRVAQVRKG